jgi:hypothetical protein
MSVHCDAKNFRPVLSRRENTRVPIQSVRMKCIAFVCNIAHQLSGTGMKTKRI